MSDNKDNIGKRKQPEKNQSSGTPGLKQPKFNPYWFYGIIAIIFIIINFYLTGSKGPVETTWNKVRTTMLASQDVDRLVVINKERANIYLKQNSLNKYDKELETTFSKPSETGPHFYFVIGSIETFERNLAEAQEAVSEDQRIEPEYRNETNWMGELLWTIGPFILIILLWWWIFKRMSRGTGGGPGGIFSVGKSQAKVFDKDSRVNTTFKEVAGLSEAKQEVEEIVEFLRNPEKFTRLGGKIPKGALLVGPPGTGKTSLLKCLLELEPPECVIFSNKQKKKHLVLCSLMRLMPLEGQGAEIPTSAQMTSARTP